MFHAFDAARVHQRDSEGERVFADAECQSFAAIGGKFLRVVQAHDAPRGIQNDGRGDNRTKQRAAPNFVNPGDAHPAALARFAFVAGRTKPPHRPAV